ncbi:MAG: crossover junction endodeoxyribonuclease RuvC [Clostridia bacterium]|nr:crossover junction endodeoxyribonuclease RuvC [Clostridia bacterium]
MIILGIDPGIATVGWGVVARDRGSFRYIDCGIISTPAGMRVERRLFLIHQALSDIIKRYTPDEISIEELFFHSNQKTVINVAQARGVILFTAEENSLPIYEYTPLQVKQSIVGYGRAEKKQVMEMTKVFLHLDRVAKPDDAADALALAICHGNSSQSKLYGLRTIKDSKKTGGQ